MSVQVAERCSDLKRVIAVFFVLTGVLNVHLFRKQGNVIVIEIMDNKMD
jgi:hypothetical protein